MVTTEIFSILAYCSPTHGALAAFWNMVSFSRHPSLHWSNLLLGIRRTVFMDTRPKSFPSPVNFLLNCGALPHYVAPAVGRILSFSGRMSVERTYFPSIVSSCFGKRLGSITKP
ncbi:hypothetical protein ACJQWK_07375 [Exserohilum turcicum]